MHPRRTSAVPLILGLFLFFAGGCGAEAVGRTPPDEEPQRDMAAPPRLVPLPDLEWWWQPANTPAGSFISREVASVWGPLARIPGAGPFSYKPVRDTKLQMNCLPYQMFDGSVRCLPGWSQTDNPMKTQNGFFVDTTINRKCYHFDDWRFAIPFRNPQKYLVLYDFTKREGVRVFEAVPETTAVFFGWYTPPAKYPDCMASRTDWNYYRKGVEVKPDVFPEIPEGMLPF